MEKPYTTRLVVFTCSNGWTIETVPEEDVEIERGLMGLNRGYTSVEAQIHSLREPDGTPHATIIGEGKRIVAFGRCSAPPSRKYQVLIDEWTEATC